MTHPLSGEQYEQGEAGTAQAPLVPMEERPHGFDVVLRGYDRDQVDRHVAWLEGLLAQAEESAGAATTAVDQARAEAMTAHQEAARAKADLERGKPTFEALGERITRMLKLAEEEADDLRAKARADSEQILAQARTMQASVQAQRDETIGKAEHEAYDIVQAARAQAEQIVADAKRRSDTTLADAQRRLAELTKQRDEIRSQLARLQQQLAALAGGEQ
ncbi:MAG: sugar-binding protein [Frankiaceae bacterium]